VDETKCEGCNETATEDEHRAMAVRFQCPHCRKLREVARDESGAIDEMCPGCGDSMTPLGRVCPSCDCEFDDWSDRT